MSQERRKLIDSENGVDSPHYGASEGRTDTETAPSINDDIRIDEVDHGGWKCFTSILLIMGLGTGLIVSIAMIVIGSKYIDSCPETRMIPVFLLIGGSFILFLYLLSLMMMCHRAYYKSRTDDEEIGTSFLVFIGCYAFILTITAVFVCAWFITGCVYVYRAYKPNFEDINCDRNLYTFSFWLLNSFFIFGFVATLITFLTLCV